MKPGYVDGFSKNELYSRLPTDECMEQGHAGHRTMTKSVKAYRNQTGPIRRGVGLATFWYNTGRLPHLAGDLLLPHAC